MRILVLGGTAWVGRTTAEIARDLGHEVTCLARGSAPFPAGVRVVRGDRTEAAAYDGLGEVDRVVDVARHPGQVRTAVDALAGRCGSYVFVSSGNVYADHSRFGADERAPLLPPLGAEAMASMAEYGEAKVACETRIAAAFPAAHVLARAGLIGGPGDDSGRTSYWPWRFARNATDPVLVPADADAPTQVVDVRDLATWLVQTSGWGAFNVTGDVTPLGEHLAAARAVAGHTGELVPASRDWLAARDVTPWMGPRSLPLWGTDEPGWEAFAAVSNARAVADGLRLRPLLDTLTDTLAWARGVERPWAAGLTDAEEGALLAELGYGPQHG